MEASIGLRGSIPGMNNQPYYQTSHNSAYGANNSAGNCCRPKEKVERKSSK